MDSLDKTIKKNKKKNRQLQIKQMSCCVLDCEI